MLFFLAFTFCVRVGINLTAMHCPYVQRQSSLNRVSKCGPYLLVRGVRYIASR
jgi:hypothetical protein